MVTSLFFAMLIVLEVHEGYMYTRGEDAERSKETLCSRSPLSYC
ncbi:hypothetical protein GLYMA_20G160701v4 [Glycine max]|nr:hypothetical protein GLYMA_20G160701v4 [Glycine max]KAH1036375.1 hypothetical protein GYH30_056037 [Glycine max]